MKKILFVLGFSFFTYHVTAQVYVPQGGCGIKYEYDAAGNRIKRYKHCWTVGPIAQRQASDSSTNIIQSIIHRWSIKTQP